LQRIGSDEDDPDEEPLFQNPWDEETQREAVIESLRADCARHVQGDDQPSHHAPKSEE
jgi:hypothetical protein